MLRIAVASVSLALISGCGGTEESTPVETSTGGAAPEVSTPAEPSPALAEDQAPTEDPVVESSTAPEETVATAAYNGNVEAIKQHIAAGSDLNEREPTGGSTPLISAATFDRREAAQALIEGGADLNLQNREGSTALRTAAFLCRTEIVAMLLEAGADKEAMNKVGSTALNGVEGPFEQMKPIYDLLGVVLDPLGLKLDYERIKATRPKIAEMLR
jgi:hypothetical protein